MGTFTETLVEGEEGALHLGLPKDIYTLINHYTDAKDIWDNVKMLLEGSELTKEDRKSQLGLRGSNYDQLYAYLKQHEAHANENRMIGQRNNARGTGVAGDEGVQHIVGYVNSGQARQIKCYYCNGGQVNIVDEDMDEQPVQDLALNVDNVFQANECDAFDSIVDEAPTA
nr:integrase, catalytic region, zinc finger, CCHC-type, peptidase aspartic, catalytic [Tanacetum cinerariifolium]